jgi:hypothetical protein
MPNANIYSRFSSYRRKQKEFPYMTIIAYILLSNIAYGSIATLTATNIGLVRNVDLLAYVDPQFKISFLYNLLVDIVESHI